MLQGFYPCLWPALFCLFWTSSSQKFNCNIDSYASENFTFSPLTFNTVRDVAWVSSLRPRLCEMRKTTLNSEAWWPFLFRAINGSSLALWDCNWSWVFLSLNLGRHHSTSMVGPEWLIIGLIGPSQRYFTTQFYYMWVVKCRSNLRSFGHLLFCHMLPYAAICSFWPLPTDMSVGNWCLAIIQHFIYPQVKG